MNIYHVKRTDHWGYDEYSEFVCYAPDEESARSLHPGGHQGAWADGVHGTWVAEDEKDELLEVLLLGHAAAEDVQPGVIIASFHAG